MHGSITIGCALLAAMEVMPAMGFLGAPSALSSFPLQAFHPAPVYVCVR